VRCRGREGSACEEAASCEHPLPLQPVPQADAPGSEGVGGRGGEIHRGARSRACMSVEERGRMRWNLVSSYVLTGINNHRILLSGNLP